MFSLTRPTEDAIRQLIDSQSRLDFSYPDVGATCEIPPRGYAVDHTRISLGEGSAVFEMALASIRRWAHFEIGWVQLCWPDTPIEAGRVVGVLTRVFGLWSLNVCRIVYVVDERGPARKFGFAYGTLPEHAESGEERFVVEHDARDDSVWYDIFAFSRPKHILARVGYPLARRLQKRFARDSGLAMKGAVNHWRGFDCALIP